MPDPIISLTSIIECWSICDKAHKARDCITRHHRDSPDTPELCKCNTSCKCWDILTKQLITAGASSFESTNAVSTCVSTDTRPCPPVKGTTVGTIDWSDLELSTMCGKTDIEPMRWSHPTITPPRLEFLPEEPGCLSVTWEPTRANTCDLPQIVSTTASPLQISSCSSGVRCSAGLQASCSQCVAAKVSARTNCTATDLPRLQLLCSAASKLSCCSATLYATWPLRQRGMSS
mmetsp:Transcript_53222/g.86166  ORF Transcript_53222/g.86166 Transcript_53222/m.86166 type:complete len:232 (-) Transcript_53222:2410-3105(-)